MLLFKICLEPEKNTSYKIALSWETMTLFASLTKVNDIQERLSLQPCTRNVSQIGGSDCGLTQIFAILMVVTRIILNGFLFPLAGSYYGEGFFFIRLHGPYGSAILFPAIQKTKKDRKKR